MLEFEPLRLEDMERVNPYLQMDGTISSIRTFASLFMWGEHYKTCYAMEDHTLFLRSCFQGERLSYHMPLGGDMIQAVKRIGQDAAARDMPYEIILLTEKGRATIESAFPGQFAFEELRSEFEYIYNTADLISLKGKKYHGKRNFINRFLTANAGEWSYLPVNPVADYDEILTFVRHWCEDQEAPADDYRYEYSAIIRALKNFELLGMRGGILRLRGRMIAFTLGSPQNAEVMDIHIEKADTSVEGAYQMINHQFAAAECHHYRYINREEDMGIDGLRQAKLSYHPAFLTAKYRGRPL